MIPAGMTDDQAVQILERQIEALKTRMATGQKILTRCREGYNCLVNSPTATLANIGEVVGDLRKGLLALLESNLMANALSFEEIKQQCEQLEEACRQRSAKVHLGGFVPAAPRR